MDRVKDKVAIVTGGSLGIGRSTCILLAREGAKIAITDINKIEGEKLADKIRRNGGIAEFWVMNTAVENEVANTFKEIEKKFGRIDVLVNNAGIAGINKPTDEVTEEEWDMVISVNVKASLPPSNFSARDSTNGVHIYPG